MDTKRLIPTIAVLLLVVLLWDRVYEFIGARLGWDMTHRQVDSKSTDATATTTTSPTTQDAASQPFVAAASIGSVATQPGTQPGGWAVVTADQLAKPVILGSTAKDGTCPLGLALSPQGAGFDSVTLNDYTKSVEAPDPYVYQLPYPDHVSMTRPLSTRTVTLDGKSIPIDTAQWRLDSSDANSARYSLDLLLEGKPAVQLVKTYKIFNRKDESNGSGYEVLLTQDIQNLTDHPITVGTTLVGTNTPPREQERPGDRQVIAAYVPTANEVTVTNHAIEEFTKDKPSKELTKGDKDAPLLWAGNCSAYFNAIVRPEATGRFTRVSAEALDTDPDAKDRFVTTTLDTSQVVPTRGNASMPLRLFFGPKLRKLLQSTYFTKPSIHYDETLVFSSGPCSYCVSDTLIGILVSLLGLFHIVFRDWGLAIIALVILVRACLHPIMKRSQANMMKMGQMGPEMERLKKKYGDDKDAISKAQMELMKQQGFTPVLGCLPLFLQMPIFISLWSCLQSTFELRHSPFLAPFGHHLTWIKDLAQPDKLFYFPNHPISFLFIHFDALNVLPLLVAVVSFINQKVTPKPPAATPEAEQQQKMMQWMTLIFPLMFYNLPSGLNLYYVTSTSIGILEGKIIRRHIKEKEEAEKAGRVIVDAKPTRGSKQNKRNEDETAPQKNRFMKWIADLQEKAEQVRRESDRDKK
jgi:YidC/Oxa1 family membrane protein insertase